MSIEFQGDNFDTPKRLFYNFYISYKNSFTIKSDVKELIPEIFYFAEMYKNVNNINLGEIDGVPINSFYFLINFYCIFLKNLLY